MLTITHTAAAGTLIEGTAAGDGTAEILRELAAATPGPGWRFSHRLNGGTWYVSRSRDRAPDLELIEATADRLRTAGHPVAIDVEADRRPFAELVADRIKRQQARAEGLAAKASRAAATEGTAHAAHDKLPIWPFGQPVIEDRGLAAVRRRRRAYEVARQATADRTEAAAAPAAAAGTTRYRYAPAVVSNRIATLQAAIRRDERTHDGYRRTLFVDPSAGQKTVDVYPPATGADREAALDQIAAADDELAYWQQIHAEQLVAGQMQEYSKATIAPGDTVLIGQHWWPVLRANATTVTVRTDCGQGRAPYTTLRGHRSAA